MGSVLPRTVTVTEAQMKEENITKLGIYKD